MHLKQFLLLSALEMNVQQLSKCVNEFSKCHTVHQHGGKILTLFLDLNKRRFTDIPTVKEFWPKTFDLSGQEDLEYCMSMTATQNTYLPIRVLAKVNQTAWVQRHVTVFALHNSLNLSRFKLRSTQNLFSCYISHLSVF